ncbi:cytochrome c [Loktanella sp. SALINAS62]|uniref:c-type cytochrome n=1 Tax=Loktanella sp. SALINAS62 TaxID=2706124 RepID=UPI001B8D5941|nr:cytochrome c [Loktanella sp. SALINAS62]MBS1303129.1 cytochrome c [Loktanella sp. SALINAS62]
MFRFLPFAVLALAACTPEQPPVNGKAAFEAKCAQCHGITGQDGVALAAGVTAPDLTRISARNGGTYPADYVMSVIDGFNRGQHVSGLMPKFGDGDLGPIIMTEEDGNPVPVPAELLALSNYIETLQR